MSSGMSPELDMESGTGRDMSPELSMESRMWHDRGPSHPRLESEFVFRRV